MGGLLFKRYNIYAIKQGAVSKLQKQGINLVCFNKWFKNKAAKISKKLREEVGKYDAVINYCDKEYCTSDLSKKARWSNTPERSDRVVMANLLNIYGLDYKDYIKNETVTKAIDKWLLIYFFAKVANSEYFNLRVFSRQELEQHVNNIAGEYNIVEDANDINTKILKLTICFVNLRNYMVMKNCHLVRNHIVRQSSRPCLKWIVLEKFLKVLLTVHRY